LVGVVVISLWQARRWRLAPVRVFDAALLGVSGALVGARLTYVTVNWAYYRGHLSEALRLGAGGLAWQGGLAVGLLLIVLYATRLQLPLGSLLDALALGLVWFVLFLWLGSGVANDIYGHETFPSDGWLWTLSADLPDLYGLRAPRVNVALLGAAWSGLVLVGLWLLTPHLTSVPGSLFLAGVGLIGLGGLLLIPLQANPAPYLLRMRLDWFFYLVLTLGGLGGLIGRGLLRTGRVRLGSFDKGQRTDDG
jgi:prolipoprotein diacylglyceryltransferase